MLKLSDSERATVEHARRWAAQDLQPTLVCFGQTYRELVAIIDRLTRKRERKSRRARSK